MSEKICFAFPGGQNFSSLAFCCYLSHLRHLRRSTLFLLLPVSDNFTWTRKASCSRRRTSTWLVQAWKMSTLIVVGQQSGILGYFYLTLATVWSFDCIWNAIDSILCIAQAYFDHYEHIFNQIRQNRQNFRSHLAFIFHNFYFKSSNFNINKSSDAKLQKRPNKVAQSQKTCRILSQKAKQKRL